MRQTYTSALIAFVFGCILLIVFAALYRNGSNVLFLESYKITLSFIMIGVLGAVIKSGIDESISRREEESRKYNEWQKTRTELVKGFSDVFSAFYSLRKAHEAALRSTNQLYDGDKYADLMRDCLSRAVVLEGKYGATKVAIIHHFRLPQGRYENKTRDSLIKNLFQGETLKKSADRNQQLRYLLDLLGEFYDLWRHRYQASTKGDRQEILDHEHHYPVLLWITYEEILGFLNRAEYPKT